MTNTSLHDTRLAGGDIALDAILNIARGIPIEKASADAVDSLLSDIQGEPPEVVRAELEGFVSRFLTGA